MRTLIRVFFSWNSQQTDLLWELLSLSILVKKRLKSHSMHFHDIYPAEGIIKSKENTRYWMDSQNPWNKNNFFGYLPFHHLKCWKVNVSWDKRQVPFHIKMTCEQHQKRNVQFAQAPGETKRPCPHISFSLLFSQATKKTKQNKPPSPTCSSVPKCTSEMCPSLTCVKSGGPQTLTNELHHTQDSTYLLWQSVSLEEWYLHMRGKNTRIKIPILSSGFCHISS